MRPVSLLSLSLLLLLTPLTEAAEPEGVVKDRIELMKEMKDQVKTIADMVRNRIPHDPPRMKQAAEKIAHDAKAMLLMFPEGSLTEASKSTADIWVKRNKFELFAADLYEEASRVAEGADYANLKLSKRQFRNMGRVCAGCHKHFRQPDERDSSPIE